MVFSKKTDTLVNHF